MLSSLPCFYTLRLAMATRGGGMALLLLYLQRSLPAYTSFLLQLRFLVLVVLVDVLFCGIGILTGARKRRTGTQRGGGVAATTAPF